MSALDFVSEKWHLKWKWYSTLVQSVYDQPAVERGSENGQFEGGHNDANSRSLIS